MSAMTTRWWLVTVAVLTALVGHCLSQDGRLDSLLMLKLEAVHKITITVYIHKHNVLNRHNMFM